MLTHKGTAEIKTERLLLRRFTLDDAQPMFDCWANDERVTRYITWNPHGEVAVTKYILGMWCLDYDKENHYQWAIELDGKLVGSISVVAYDDNSERAEIGYCMGFDYWGRGIMTEAVKAVVDFLFTDVGCNRIEIVQHIENPASGRVAQKCGFTKEGVRREYFNKNGVFHDDVMYALLRKDWSASKE